VYGARIDDWQRDENRPGRGGKEENNYRHFPQHADGEAREEKKKGEEKKFDFITNGMTRRFGRTKFSAARTRVGITGYDLQCYVRTHDGFPCNSVFWSISSYANICTCCDRGTCVNHMGFCFFRPSFFDRYILLAGHPRQP
jgi:hypothetical protein